MSKKLRRCAPLVLAWIGLACSSQQAGDPEPPAPAVEAVAARAGTLPLEERVSGVVRAEGQITVRPEIDAAVVSVHVRSGEAVSRGQLLVRLDDRELREAQRAAEATVRLEEAATTAARARVAELSAQVRRSRELAEQQLIARLEIETQEAQLAAAEASAAESAARVDQVRATLAQREQALSRTEIRAPVSGRVGRRNAEVGLLVGPSTVLFELGNLDNVRVEIPLTGEMLAKVKPGQPVLVHPGQGAEPIAAKLTRVSPFLAAGSFSTTGEIDVPRGHAERLPPGLFVAVDLLYGESAPATLVPNSALHEDPRTGVRGVYVLDLGSAKLAPGQALGDRAFPARLKPVEVIGEGRQTAGVGGLQEGEWVVTVGQHLLASDGSVAARVRPVSWERVLGLQALQREDLLRAFLAEQRKVARERGAVPPDNREFQKAAR